MTDDWALLAGVELGGTKCVAVLGNAERVIERVRIPTTTPDETLSALAVTLAAWRAAHGIAALGIGSFGPIRIDRAATDYGRMLATPKPGWAGADIVGALARGFRRHRLHTDVTAAALAERACGAARGTDDLVYITIGTGIGVGIVVNGAPVSGMLHPEAGHVRVRRRDGDAFAGSCPTHGDCLEGLVSGPAIAARFAGLETLPDPEDPRWSPVAEALGEAIAMLLLTLSPARIVIGGGVALGRPQLIAQARARAAALLGGYLPDIATGLADRIVPAALGADAGPLGTLILARDAERAPR